MKFFLTTLLFLVSFFINAQMMNITYVTVPRENSETFLKLHEKFMNLSISEDRSLKQSVIFAHAFAGDYTFAIYDVYATAEDLVTDAALADAAMKEKIAAMKLDESAAAAMTADFQSYSAMYAHNHTDQIRTNNGLEALTFESKDIDWSTKKVVVVGKYNTKWGRNKIFYNGVLNGSLKNVKESKHAVAAYASQHLYGTGADWHTYQFFDSWTDFAAFEEANLGNAMTEDDKKFWSVIEGHEDEILMLIGSTDPKTKIFSLKK